MVNTANCVLDTCIRTEYTGSREYSCIHLYSTPGPLIHTHTSNSHRIRNRRRAVTACGRAHAPRAAPLAIARHAVPRAFKAQQAPCAPSNFEVLFIRLMLVCVFVVIPGSFRDCDCDCD